MSTMPSTIGDTEFLALYRSVSSTGASILRAGAAFTGAQREALIEDLRSGDSPRARAALASLGMSERLVNKQRRLVAAFAARRPLPQDTGRIRALVEEAVAAAKLSFPDGGGPAPDPLDEITDELGLPDSDDSGGPGSPGGDTGACHDACAAQAAAGAALALTSAITGMVACQALGPFGIVCALGVMASYAYALYSLDAVVDRCVANCG